MDTVEENWWCRKCGWYPDADMQPMPQGYVEHECIEDPDKKWICPVTENTLGTPCGKPAKKYRLGTQGWHIACNRHRLVFLAILNNIREELEK
jgi:hypothetical protein